MEQLCQELMTCVTVIYEPSSSPEKRKECTETVDRFKECHESCLQCGLCLAAQDQNPVARHFGLQLLEHMVKHRWDSMNKESRQDFRQFLVKFLQTSVTDGDAGFVKEAAVRLTVETTKRLWPQLWPSFMQDMNTVCSAGVVQVQLVLGIFCRLSEDVHEFAAGLDQLRKKEMTHALNQNITEIYAFVLQNLEVPVVTDPSQQLQVRATCLSTLTSLLEWVEFGVLLSHECKLLTLLCTLLSVEELKLQATECLMGLLARKGDVKRTAEEREKLLWLLSAEALDVLWSVSLRASSLVFHEGDVLEDEYVFLKRMCQILVHLGTSQLGPLWLNAKESFQVPEGFVLYLDVLLKFTMLDSQLLSMTTCDVWQVFVNHNHIKECEAFKQFLPKILTECRKKLMKLGDPTTNTHAASKFSRIDFEDEDKFTLFFSMFRSKLTRIVAHITQAMPRGVAREARDTVEALVTSTSQSTDYSHYSEKYLEWDACAMFLDCWINCGKTEPSLLEIDVVKECGVAILRYLVEFSTASALILQCQFRCLQSGLLHFLHLDQNLFQDYMKKVFSSVGFLGGHSDKYDLPKDVVQARNSIVQCFTHLCGTYPKLLAPHLESFFDVYSQLVKDDELVNAEKTSFMEALLILSLESRSNEDQDRCFEVLFHEVETLFHKLKSGVASLESFIQLLSLDQEPDSPGYIHEKKRELCYVVNSTVVVLKKLPPLQQPTTSNCRLQLVLPVVLHLCIPLIRLLYQLWTGQFSGLLANHFKAIDQLNAYERDIVLGKTIGRRVDVNRSEVHNVQVNLAAVHEGCLISVVHCLRVFGYQLMCECEMVSAAIEAVSTGMTSLNQYRLRTVLRHLVEPMVSSCPPELWDAILCPMLVPICCHIFTKLRESWATVVHKQGQNATTTSEPEEVFFEQMTTILSKEFSNLLDGICVRKVDGAKKGVESPGVEDVEMTDNTVEDAQGLVKWSQFYFLSPLAEKLLENTDMRGVLILSSFCGLAWQDSYTSNKCTGVAGLLYEKVMMTDPPEVVLDLFKQVLSALHIHGTRDNVKSQLSFLAFLIYQSAVFKYPRIEDILLECSKVDKSKTEAFKKLLDKKPPATLKKKKERFRELIASVIGKHVGELYKHRPTFDLPEMEFKKKAEALVRETDLSSLFQQD